MWRRTISVNDVIKKPSLWSRIDRSHFDQCVVELCQRYTSREGQDEQTLASFDAMYSRALADLSPRERSNLIDRVASSLPVGIDAINTLVLFVLAEPDPGTAATAVIYMAHLAPLATDDPLSGLTMLVRLYDHAQTSEDARIGIFRGVLLLGDRRVRPILTHMWEGLGRHGKDQALHAKSGVIYASTAEFLLDRLDKDSDEGMFGLLAAALYRLPEESAEGPRPGYVVDAERRFPSSFRDGQPTVTLLNEWTIAEYGARLAPHMRKLAQRESEPKVLPHVMAVWGIEPSAGKRPFGTMATSLRGRFRSSGGGG